jgi:hypothetical protein
MCFHIHEIQFQFSLAVSGDENITLWQEVPELDCIFWRVWNCPAARDRLAPAGAGISGQIFERLAQRL